MSSLNHPDTPNIPSSSAILGLKTSTLIDAPIQDVWNALTDTSTYPRWNRFVPRVTVREQPDKHEDATLKSGTRFTFHVNMYPETDDEPQPQKSNLRDTFLRIIEFEPPASTGNASDWRKGRVVWASDPAADGYVMSSLLTAERVHEVEEVIDGNGKRMTKVTNWESQIGNLAYVVRWMFGARLRANFAVWERGLKKYAEHNSEDESG
ncbi:SRPBCC domain-containing protein [Aspergillus mulundensis]|uniref:Uncharacterized protein n=1 Tax=Aspergillus mulundensis TaxID=1810919 RepID=A0A3D8SK61_9EURO|nr:Uncharacterized protein DSM5745_03367 [Aspergillus mulundensis]RDW86725.1 Uncharacterized protein DSM5745_03367 [Aspergillus mulundensis]